MKLGISTYLFFEMPLSYAFREIAGLGFSQVELSYAIDMSDAEIDELNGLEREYGIRVASIHAPARKDLHPQGWIPFHSRLLEYAVAIGCEAVVTHLEVNELSERGDAYIEDVIMMARRAKEMGATWTIENAGEPLADMERVILSDADIGFTLDVQHALHYHKGYDPWTYLDRFGERLANMHVLGVSDQIQGLAHGVPQGFSDLDWNALADTLQTLNYRGPIAIEHNLCAFTRMLVTFLPVLEKAFKERTEMSIIPLHTAHGSGTHPREILDMDPTPLKLVYDPAASRSELTMEHALALYSKQFCEEVFGLG